MTNNYYVFYHKNCSDGAAGAYAAWKALGDKVTYIPISYNDKFPNIKVNENTIIYIVDFCIDINLLIDLSKKCKLVQIIDHHLSAYTIFINHLTNLYLKDKCNIVTHFLVSSLLKNCSSYYDYVCKYLGIMPPVFDMNHSGAMLAWMYFHPNTTPPAVIKYVEDRDLWRFKHTNTKPMMESIFLSGKMNDFKYWDGLVTNNAKFYEQLEQGHCVLKYQSNIINQYHVNQDFAIKDIDGYRVAIINATNLISEVSESFYERTDLDVDYTMVYYIKADGCAKVSFRSKNHHTPWWLKFIGLDRTINIIPMAQKYGGGGHPSAAGAHLTFEQTIELLKFLNS